MANQEQRAIVRSRIKRSFADRYRSAASWMARPKTVALVIVAGYVVIFIGWLFYLAVQPAEPGSTQKLFSWQRFNEDTGPFTLMWNTLVVVITFLASMPHRKWEDALRLRSSQKERIRILDNFQPSQSMIEFFDNRSIYDAILTMLYRLNDEGDHGPGKTHYNVCMLLCSPALDYCGNEKSRSPGSKQSEWGLEFRDIVEKLVAHKDIEFDICHLPVEPFSGVNALRDFISALATYTIQSEDQLKSDDAVKADAEFQTIFGSIWDRSGLVANDFANWSTDVDKKDRFHVKTHTINIPFQVVLVDSKDVMEVVVSFAGREVLEREQRRGVKGFYSSDPYVVKTFREVFRMYVESKGRIPYIPSHTSKVSDSHDAIGPHIIPGYYNKLVGPLRVLPETFSPVVGNSTKFTVWLLDKLITTGDPDDPDCWGKKVKKILDIGSGTGVLALATGAILQARFKRTDYTITAIDSCPYAQRVLRLNTTSDPRIKVNPWTLRFTANKEGEVTDAWFEDDSNQRVAIEGDFAGFDLVTGDLPFVHARKRTEKDLRFLDLDHRLHQALFWVAAQTKLLTPAGLLVTAFSSLGGPEDIAEFERHLRNNALQVIQRVEFHESGYMWMVYVLMKKPGYDAYQGKLWWKVLDAERYVQWDPKT